MNETVIQAGSVGASLSRALGDSGDFRMRLRAAIAAALLLALGALVISSASATTDAWSFARARHEAPPASHNGPIHPPGC